MGKAPEVTVGLPLYDMGNIAWLAIESLCNQKKAPAFELIVMEEEDNCFGAKLMEYADRLKQAGCVGIIHHFVKKRITLGEKWYEIMRLMHQESKIFMLQAGDCYAHPCRLLLTYQYMETLSCDYYDERKGLFYDIRSQKLILFDGKDYGHPCNLNMAYSAKLFRRLPRCEVPCNVDFYIYKTLEKVNGKPLIKYRLPHRPTGGFDTNGANKISKRAQFFTNPTPPFYSVDFKAVDIIPIGIIEKLNNSITNNRP